MLLILTMTMSFTGYLLPFDQRSYWATIVGVNINGTGPLVGPFLSDFLRGGAEFGATTLSRFYAIHMLLVPGADRRADRRPPLPRRQARHHGAAVAEGRAPTDELRPRAGLTMNQREKEQYLREYSLLKAQGKPFFPYAVAKDSIDGGHRVLVDHPDVADPRRRARPEGGPDDDDLRAAAGVVLLLPLRAAARHQAGRSSTPLATIGVPTICMILLFLLPFYDRSPERRPERRPIATTAGIFTIVAMAYLTYLGASPARRTRST